MCEIAKGTTAKMEINKEAAFNPIIQDRKKDGSLRHYKYNPEVRGDRMRPTQRDDNFPLVIY